MDKFQLTTRRKDQPSIVEKIECTEESYAPIVDRILWALTKDNTTSFSVRILSRDSDIKWINSPEERVKK